MHEPYKLHRTRSALTNNMHTYSALHFVASLPTDAVSRWWAGGMNSLANPSRTR